MCLFTPKWKSGNETEACRAILNLSKGKRTDKIVREILENDKRRSVIVSALSVCSDDNYKKNIYETSDVIYVRAAALSNIENDPEYVKDAITKEKWIPSDTVKCIGGDKNFAYGILYEDIKLADPTPPKEFYFNLVQLIYRLSDRADNERMKDLIFCSENRTIIEQAMRYFELKHDKDALINFAGDGMIYQQILSSYPTTPNSPILYTVDDYKKKCAREILTKWGYVSGTWTANCIKGSE